MYTVELYSVSVGGPKVLIDSDPPVYSSINRRPIAGRSAVLTWTGLAGDQPTDTRPHKGGQMHGGFDKALYVYPLPHYRAWEEPCGRMLAVPSFGENLTVIGPTETDVHIGDIWSWDGTELEVTKPRTPCMTLNHHLGLNAIKTMQQNGLCGWYMRVRKVAHTGTAVPTTGELAVLHIATGQPTVAEVFAQKMSKQ